MWGNAALLKTLANALFVLSALAALYGVFHAFMHQTGLFPVRHVRLEAPLRQVDAGQVQTVVRSGVRGNLFTADIAQLRQSLEQVPWVRSVTIRREFPDRLAVRLEEHEALARWNGAAWVNTYGEVFGAEHAAALPDFIGPEGSSADVARQYAAFGAQLGALNLRITRLALTSRHAWQLHLDSGLVLELGREHMQQRLARFVAAYPHSIAAMRGSIRYVDLRYRNGFAAGGESVKAEG
jgi:cell division protein FtsQ